MSQQISDESFHHKEQENNPEEVEKKIMDQWTQEEVEQKIQDMMDDWVRDRSWLWKSWSWVYGKVFPHQHKSTLYTYDDGEFTSLRLRCTVNNKSTVQSKIIALTAHWLLQQFVIKLWQKDPETLNLVGRMMFLGKGRVHV